MSSYSAIVNATKGRPWLWAVYLIAILLPIIILIVFCWSRKSPKERSDGLRKKTDEAEPDSTEPLLQTETATAAADDDDEEEDEEVQVDEPLATEPTGNKLVESDTEEQREETEVNIQAIFRLLFSCVTF